MIEVRDLRKTFWVSKHHRGLTGALRNLVTRAGTAVPAVDGISFRIDGGEMVGMISIKDVLWAVTEPPGR